MFQICLVKFLVVYWIEIPSVLNKKVERFSYSLQFELNICKFNLKIHQIKITFRICICNEIPYSIILYKWKYTCLLRIYFFFWEYALSNFKLDLHIKADSKYQEHQLGTNGCNPCPCVLHVHKLMGGHLFSAVIKW